MALGQSQRVRTSAAGRGQERARSGIWGHGWPRCKALKGWKPRQKIQQLSDLTGQQLHPAVGPGGDSFLLSLLIPLVVMNSTQTRMRQFIATSTNAPHSTPATKTSETGWSIESQSHADIRAIQLRTGTRWFRTGLQSLP